MSTAPGPQGTKASALPPFLTLTHIHPFLLVEVPQGSHESSGVPSPEKMLR